MNIIVRKGELKPSENKHENITEQFLWRTTGKFEGDNQIVIMDTKEPCWWNRPLTSDVMCKLEDDGIYSYNLPFLGNRDVYKTGYNLLLCENSVTYTAHIKTDGLTDEQIKELYDLDYKVLYDALVELGVKKEDLEITRNDMLYKGKKFAGGEKVIRDGVFTEDLVITVLFEPEKEIFSRLTGKYANTRGITGVGEENSQVTKEILIDKMYEKIKDFLAKIDL